MTLAICILLTMYVILAVQRIKFETCSAKTANANNIGMIIYMSGANSISIACTLLVPQL